MKPSFTVTNLLDFLSGEGDESVNTRIREELNDPQSSASVFFRGLRMRAERAFDIDWSQFQTEGDVASGQGGPSVTAHTVTPPLAASSIVDVATPDTYVEVFVLGGDRPPDILPKIERTVDVPYGGESTLSEAQARLAHLRSRGRYRSALRVARKLYKATRRCFPMTHPRCINALVALGLALESTGNLHQARTRLEQALRLARSLPEQPKVATILSELGSVLEKLAQYDAAAECHGEALHLREKLLGPRAVATAHSLVDLGSLSLARGDHTRAKGYFERALAIYRETAGENSRDTATCLHNMALVYHNVGDYLTAEEYYSRSLAIERAIVGPDHIALAPTLSSLGVCYMDMGRFADAAPLLEQALDLRRRAFGEKHTSVGLTLSYLGTLHRQIGDLAAAEDCYRRARSIQQKAVGFGHPRFASIINNLGTLLCVQGRYDEARLLLEQSLRIGKNNLGPRHPDLVVPLSNLGSLMQAQGAWSEARRYFERALELLTTIYGDSTPTSAQLHRRLGEVAFAEGDPDAADTQLKKARTIAATTLTKRHPAYADILEALADVAMQQGGNREAYELLREASSIDDETLRQAMAITVEAHRSLVIASIRRRQDALLSLVVESFRDDQHALAVVFELVARRRLLERGPVAAGQESAWSRLYPDAAELLREGVDLRRSLTMSKLSVPETSNGGGYKETLVQYERKLQELDDTLATRIPEFASERRRLGADREAIAAALPAGSMVVEVVRVAARDPSRTTASPVRPQDRYIAFSLGASGQNVELIEVRDVSVPGVARAGSSTADEVHAQAVRLQQALLEQVIWSHQDIEVLFVSPDEPVGDDVSLGLLSVGGSGIRIQYVAAASDVLVAA